MQTPRFTPAFIEEGDFETHAFNDSCSRTVEAQPPSRILVALQDPQARRGMSRALRASEYRVITLDEPFAAWGMVAEHASPRLAGFDFVICGGFRSGRGPEALHGAGTRFFLLRRDPSSGMGISSRGHRTVPERAVRFPTAHWVAFTCARPAGEAHSRAMSTFRAVAVTLALATPVACHATRG
jgi:hypothetical protein